MGRETTSLAFQIVFSTLAIIANIFLLHILTRKRDIGEYLEKQWRTLGLSLSLSHIVIGACLLTINIMKIIIDNYFGSSNYINLVRIHMMYLGVFLVMVHNLSVMVSDFKLVILLDALPSENIFYIAVCWATTTAVGIMMPFTENPTKITYILCIIFMLGSIMLLLMYIGIFRRGTWLLNNEDCVIERNKHFLFLGTVLAVLFVFSIVPFALERLVWKQNGSVSAFCVIINSLLQGIVCVFRLRWIRK